MEMMGIILAILGAALSSALAGIGSSIGCGITGQTAAGVTTEDPGKFGKTLVLQALPGTQGIYGFIGLFFVLNITGLLRGEPLPLTVDQGWQICFACLPVGVVGLISAVYQGMVASSGCGALAKRPEVFGKAVIYAAMVETYAILGLLSTILLLMGIQLPTG